MKCDPMKHFQDVRHFFNVFAFEVFLNFFLKLLIKCWPYLLLR